MLVTLSLSLSCSPTSRWPLKVHVNFVSHLRSADVSTTHRFTGVRNTETDKDPRSRSSGTAPPLFIDSTTSLLSCMPDGYQAACWEPPQAVARELAR